MASTYAVLHLLYARFWNRFLYDIGIVSNKEPFQLVINQGMILIKQMSDIYDNAKKILTQLTMLKKQLNLKQIDNIN